MKTDVLQLQWVSHWEVLETCWVTVNEKKENQSHRKVFDTSQYLCPVFQHKVTGSEIKEKMWTIITKRRGPEDNFYQSNIKITEHLTSPWFLHPPVWWRHLTDWIDCPRFLFWTVQQLYLQELPAAAPRKNITQFRTSYLSNRTLKQHSSLIQKPHRCDCLRIWQLSNTPAMPTERGRSWSNLNYKVL